MKQIQQTQPIIDLLRAALGADANLGELAVFESVSLNTLPLSKGGSIFDKGVVSATTLRELASVTNTETYVPLHTMHQQSSELPVGRVFHAEVKERTNGLSIISDLHTLFFISKSTPEGADLINKLDTGIINEVSVGFRSKQMLCSECNFDYMGPEATFRNFWDRECDQGHVIGEDGVHLRLEGVDRFLELSLVSRGAANNTQILTRQQARIASDEGLRSLAASSNISNELAFIYASKGEEIPMTKMTQKDRQVLIATLTERSKDAVEGKFAKITDLLATVTDETTYEQALLLKADFDSALAEFALTTKIDPEPKPADPVDPAPADPVDPAPTQVQFSLNDLVDARADVKIATTQLTVLQTEVATLTAQAVESATLIVSLQEAAVNHAAVKAELTAAEDFLKLSCQNLLVATGVDKPQIPESISDLILTIKTAQGQLSKLPVGGLALAANAGSGSPEKINNSDTRAYQTKK